SRLELPPRKVISQLRDEACRPHVRITIREPVGMDIHVVSVSRSIDPESEGHLEPAKLRANMHGQHLDRNGYVGSHLIRRQHYDSVTLICGSGLGLLSFRSRRKQTGGNNRAKSKNFGFHE